MAMIEAFTTWFKNHGGEMHPDVEFAWSHQNGFYLRMKEKSQASSESIKRNTTIISCPHALSLSALNALHAPIFEADNKYSQLLKSLNLPPEFLRDARPQCVAAVWLCVHFMLQDRSQWQGYISALPSPPPVGRDGALDGIVADGGEGETVIDTAVWWTEEERMAIAGTNLARGIEDLETAWKKEWEFWKDLLLEWTEKNGLNGLDWRLFKWGVSIYGSRAFSSAVIAYAIDERSEKRLVEIHDPNALLYPGVDMLNHSNETENGWFCDRTRFALVCNDEPCCGQEIFNSYGMKDNGSLLLSFGFAILHNSNDAFALKLPRIETPALLEKFRASNSQAQEYKSAASALRLAASKDANQKSESPGTPGQIILINETETPLSHDPDHNVFYVRLPSTLLRLSSSHKLLPNPGYPELPNGPPYLDHLYGFPSALLENLAVRLANERETEEAMNVLSTTKPSNDLLALLGERNQMAVTILLMNRLRMEASRLLSLGLLSEATIVLPEAEVDSTATVAERRHQQSMIYVWDQHEILLDTISLLREKILTALAGQYIHNDLANTTALWMYDTLHTPKTRDTKSPSEEMESSLSPAVEGGGAPSDAALRAERNSSRHQVEEEEHKKGQIEREDSSHDQVQGQREDSRRRTRRSADLTPTRAMKRPRIEAEEGTQTEESSAGSAYSLPTANDENSDTGSLSWIRKLVQQKPVISELFTVPRAVNILADLSTEISSDFVKAVTYCTNNGIPDELNSYSTFLECVDGIRISSDVWGENSILVLWILVVYVLHNDSNLHGSMNGEVRHFIVSLCSFWARFYGLEKKNMKEVREYDADSDSVVIWLADEGPCIILGELRDVFEPSDLWKSELWDDAARLVSVAQRIVKEETVSVLLGEDEYSVLFNAEYEPEDEWDTTALQDADPQVEMDGDDVVPVLAMYLPANY